MASSEFTEHLPGSNKVHYPISGRNDFTVSMKNVLASQYMMLSFKKFILLMGTNLQESAYWFKLTNNS